MNARGFLLAVLLAALAASTLVLAETGGGDQLQPNGVRSQQQQTVKKTKTTGTQTTSPTGSGTTSGGDKGKSPTLSEMLEKLKKKDYTGLTVVDEKAMDETLLQQGVLNSLVQAYDKAMPEEDGGSRSASTSGGKQRAQGRTSSSKPGFVELYAEDHAAAGAVAHQRVRAIFELLGNTEAGTNDRSLLWRFMSDSEKNGMPDTGAHRHDGNANYGDPERICRALNDASTLPPANPALTSAQKLNAVAQRFADVHTILKRENVGVVAEMARALAEGVFKCANRRTIVAAYDIVTNNCGENLNWFTDGIGFECGSTVARQNGDYVARLQDGERIYFFENGNLFSAAFRMSAATNQVELQPIDRVFARGMGVSKWDLARSNRLYDQAGHIVPHAIGGSRCAHNLFPQSMVLNAHPASHWKLAEDEAIAIVRTQHCTADVVIYFDYDAESAHPTRPTRISYSVTGRGDQCPHQQSKLYTMANPVHAITNL